jgi:small subunit ribosomal protein S1
MGHRKTKLRLGAHRAADMPAEDEVEAAPAVDAAPPPSEPSNRRVDLEDLELFASMDPSELAAALEGSLESTRIEVGSEARGTVSRVGRNELFVDLGGKAEAHMELAEQPNAKVGDPVRAYVISVGDVGIRLSTKLQGAAADEHIEEAYASGKSVRGEVVRRNRGGFDVRIGSARAFCPVSRISRLPSVDLDSYIGRTLDFRITETGDNVVVDRRVIQEEEIESKAASLWEELAVGDERQGTVRNVTTFGAFVDIGGVDGLVPRREMSWDRGASPEQILQRGQSVQVRVLEIDREGHKLTLSCKDPSEEPWQRVESGLVRSGQVLNATVVSVQPFGAFADLGGGLQGLVHISKFPGGLPAEGDKLTVRINNIDMDRRRLELAPVAEGAESLPSAVSEVATKVRGTVSQILRNGLTVQLDDGRSGWLAATEVDLPPGTMLAQRFRRNKAIEATVLRVDGNRVVLTTREQKDDSNWRSKLTSAANTGGGASGFGTFGDLFAKLKKD